MVRACPTVYIYITATEAKTFLCWSVYLCVWRIINLWVTAPVSVTPTAMLVYKLMNIYYDINIHVQDLKRWEVSIAYMITHSHTHLWAPCGRIVLYTN